MKAKWIAVGLLCISAVAPAAVSITPVRVVETRQKELAPQAQMPMGFGSELAVTLKLDGAEMKGATQYGKLKILEATDDTGGTLLQEKGAFSAGPSTDGFQAFESPMMGMSQDKPAEPRHEVELKLKLSARKATKIAKLKGQLQVLAGGEAKTVEVKGLPSLVGKTINNPVLKQAGVAIQILDPKNSPSMPFMPQEGGATVALEIMGNRSSLQQIDVIDATGESLGQGTSSMSMGDDETRMIMLKKPLDATMKLKLSLSVGQKAVTVPFDLKNIPLP